MAAVGEAALHLGLAGQAIGAVPGALDAGAVHHAIASGDAAATMVRGPQAVLETIDELATLDWPSVARPADERAVQRAAAVVGAAVQLAVRVMGRPLSLALAAQVGAARARRAGVAVGDHGRRAHRGVVLFELEATFAPDSPHAVQHAAAPLFFDRERGASAGRVAAVARRIRRRPGSWPRDRPRGRTSTPASPELVYSVRVRYSGLTLVIAAMSGTAAADPVVKSAEAGGQHIRLATEHGPVHLWMPPGYRQETAGIALYVHGYYTDVDRAWTEHRLAAQFRDSGRNALFIAPEAPAGAADEVRWPLLASSCRSAAPDRLAPPVGPGGGPGSQRRLPHRPGLARASPPGAGGPHRRAVWT